MGAADRVRASSQAWATNSAHSASVATRTPSSAAFFSFDPAPGPAATRSVLALTDPAARAAFALLIANILAGPLIDLAPVFAASLAPGASVVMASLLDTQANTGIAAYEAKGMEVVERGAGEWCVLVLEAAERS